MNEPEPDPEDREERKLESVLEIAPAQAETTEKTEEAAKESDTSVKVSLLEPATKVMAILTDTRHPQQQQQQEQELDLTEAAELIKKIRFKINVAQTRYSIVKKVAATVCNWRLKELTEDCDGAVGKAKQLSTAYDLTWHDTQVSAEFF